MILDDGALDGYRRIEAEFPALVVLPTFSAEWYRLWRDLHLAAYPDADGATRANFDMFVDMAERRKPTKGAENRDYDKLGSERQ